MKTGQWALAVGILAAMVFGIAWALTHDFKTGDRIRPLENSKGATALRLNFPYPKYPPYGGVPVLCELDKGGECDFWFTNPNDKPVKVGLLKKSCRCAGIRLQVVGREGPAMYMAATAGIEGIVPDPCGGVLNYFGPRILWGALSVWQDEWARQQKTSSDDDVELTEEAGNSATVPAGAIGKVHLAWKTERVENQTLKIMLWTDHRVNTIPTELDAATAIVPALEVVHHGDLGALEARQLPYTTDVFCYSQTRDSIPLQARVLHDNRPPEQDPVEVGPVVPATPEDRAKLAGEVRANIRCAYKTTVTLRPVAPDGRTPFEQGLFHRRVEFSGPDGIQPLEASVTGRLVAVVTVGDAEGAGYVAFGPFLRSEGMVKKVVLHSDAPKLELEVDTDPGRVPEFIDTPKLEFQEETPSGHRTWLLTLQIPPNKGRGGRFPNAEDPAYRDSAIYIKTKEKPPRTIRVPLSGVANDD
jgi:hypothetical protein